MMGIEEIFSAQIYSPREKVYERRKLSTEGKDPLLSSLAPEKVAQVDAVASINMPRRAPDQVGSSSSILNCCIDNIKSMIQRLTSSPTAETRRVNMYAILGARDVAEFFLYE